MKTVRLLNLLLILGLLTACGGGGTVTPTQLPTAPAGITPAPSAEAALRAFLDAMLVEDYPTMYSLIAQANRNAISEADFAQRYTDDLNAMSAKTIEYSIQSTLTNPQSSQAAFQIIYHTVLFGDIQRDFNTTLVMENGQWRFQWDDGLIMPELAGGKRLITSYTTPARGDIYDRNGNPIAIQTNVVALGLVAGQVSPDNEDTVFNILSQLTGVRPVDIRYNYENYVSGNYVPVGEATADAVTTSGILNFSGVSGTPYTNSSRFYEPNAAPNAVGYTLFISAEELNTYRRLGYSGAERVGVEGIEKWGEDYLRGRNGATLYIASADGTYEKALAQVDPQPASSITLTIDEDLQTQAQAAMDGLPGAIVVMEMNTGRVLTMVSSPGFDPNWYDTNNINGVNGPYVSQKDTFNRAAQGTYPLGSVFKIITMAAALESGVFTPDTTYQCGYAFTDIPGHTLFDWTWDRCTAEMQQNGTNKCTGANAQPSGLLTLTQGLMRSCDPWFYHIGYDLFNLGKGNLITDMATAFGLGKATGIEQVAESTGNIPTPADGLQATSIAIGQSDVQVTALQVARYMAAVGNGGTLFRPQLVETIQPVSGSPTQVFKADAMDTLPLSQANLQAIQTAMRSVVQNPRGTAYARFTGFSIPVSAKTGTAESGTTDPHAWFAGYSLAAKPDKPDIAVAVLVNNQGEGATWAAPIFRRVMEIYFFGRPQTTYPWESSFGVVNPDYGVITTPTPTATP
jgi:penicillin-binding protein 2